MEPHGAHGTPYGAPWGTHGPRDIKCSILVQTPPGAPGEKKMGSARPCPILTLGAHGGCLHVRGKISMGPWVPHGAHMGSHGASYEPHMGPHWGPHMKRHMGPHMGPSGAPWGPPYGTPSGPQMGQANKLSAARLSARAPSLRSTRRGDARLKFPGRDVVWGPWTGPEAYGAYR